MDDADAVQRCLEGQPDAFRTLVTRYQNRALGHAMAILRNRDDAQDAVQDAFLSAHQALRNFDRGRAFSAWFYAILRNCCYGILARRKGDLHYEAAPVELLESAGAPVDEHLAIERALAALPPPDREIVMLRHFDGLSYAELAAALGIPAGTVMSRLFNARKRLRDSLTSVPPPRRTGEG